MEIGQYAIDGIYALLLIEITNAYVLELMRVHINLFLSIFWVESVPTTIGYLWYNSICSYVLEKILMIYPLESTLSVHRTVVRYKILASTYRNLLYTYIHSQVDSWGFIVVISAALICLPTRSLIAFITSFIGDCSIDGLKFSLSFEDNFS